MILDSAAELPHAATLDDLFRRAGVRHPQATALIDPSDREQFTDGAPRTLSYAAADELISAFAGRLRALGLHTDSVVAIQLPNTVDGVIALLGTLRAGMIAAMLPLLWRQQEIVTALRDVGCKAIITCARAGRHSPAKAAVLAAAELFPIRHICGFGPDLPDGVVPLDDPGTQSSAEGMHAQPRPGVAAAHVAVLTFDVTAQRVIAVPRSHVQLIAGGLAPYREAAIAEGLIAAYNHSPCYVCRPRARRGAMAPVRWNIGSASRLQSAKSRREVRCHERCDNRVARSRGQPAGRKRWSRSRGCGRRPMACAGTARSVRSMAGKIQAGGCRRVRRNRIAVGGRQMDGTPALIPQGLVSSPRGATGSTTS